MEARRLGESGTGGAREREREREPPAGRVSGGDLATGICNELDTQGSKEETGRAGTREGRGARGTSERAAGVARRGEVGEPGVAQGPLDRVRHPARILLIRRNSVEYAFPSIRFSSFLHFFFLSLSRYSSFSVLSCLIFALSYRFSVLSHCLSVFLPYFSFFLPF